MEAVKAKRYNPSEDDADIIDITPVSSNLSVTNLAVMAKTVLIKADNLTSSGKTSGKEGKDDNNERAEKPTKAPSWVKQFAAKITGKSFSKEEVKLIEKEKERKKAKRAREWESKTKRWRSSVLRGFKNMLTNNPIANFIKNHWGKILIGAIAFFSSPEFRKDILKGMAKVILWVKNDLPSLLLKLMDIIEDVSEWIFGKKSNKKEVAKQRAIVSEAEAEGPSKGLFGFGAETKEEWRARVKEEKAKLKHMESGGRSGGVFDSFYKQVVVATGALAILSLTLGGPAGLIGAIGTVIGGTWAAGKFGFKTATRINEGRLARAHMAHGNFPERTGTTGKVKLGQLGQGQGNKLGRGKLHPQRLRANHASDLQAQKFQTKPTTAKPISTDLVKPTNNKLTKIKPNAGTGPGLLSKLGKFAMALDFGLTAKHISDTNDAYLEGELTKKQAKRETNETLGSYGTRTATAIAGGEVGAAIGGAIGGTLTLGVGAIPAAAIGAAVGSIGAVVAGEMSGLNDYVSEKLGDLSDKWYKEETKTEAMANRAMGIDDDMIGDGSEIENIHEFKQNTKETLQALLKEREWSKEDKETILKLIESKENENSVSDVVNPLFDKFDKMTDEELTASMEKSNATIDKWISAQSVQSDKKTIANTPFKELAKSLKDVETGVGGIVGSDSAPAVTVMQTNKPEDMNSHEGVEGTWSQVGDDWVFYSKNATEKESSLGKLGVKTKNDVVAGMTKGIGKKYDDVVAAETRGLEINDFDNMSKEDQTKLIEFGKTRGVKEAKVRDGYFDTSNINETGDKQWHNANDRARLKTGMRYKERKKYFREHGKEAPVAIDPLTGKPFKDLQDLTHYDMASRGAIHDPRIPVTRKGITDPLFSKTKDGEKKSTWNKWLPFGHDESEFPKRTSLGDRFKQLGNWLWDDDKKDAGPVTDNTLGKTKATTTAEPIVKEKFSEKFSGKMIAKEPVIKGKPYSKRQLAAVSMSRQMGNNIPVTKEEEMGRAVLKGTTPMGSTESVTESKTTGPSSERWKSGIAGKLLEKFRSVKPTNRRYGIKNMRGLLKGGQREFGGHKKPHHAAMQIWEQMNEKERKKFAKYKPEGVDDTTTKTPSPTSSLGTAPIVTPTSKIEGFIAKEPVIKGKPYSKIQIAAVSMSRQMGNNIPVTKEEEMGRAILKKENASKPLPMSEPSKRTETMSGIHKQNADLKTKQQSNVVAPVNNVTNNYSGSGSSNPAVITKPTVGPVKEFDKGY